MKKNKQIIRGIMAYKQNAVFSLIGLSIGLSCMAIISSWAYTHLSFDRFHTDADNIYFVQYTDTVYNETDFVNPFPLAQALREHIPGMENTATYTYWTDKMRAKTNGKEHYLNITSVEQEVLHILDFDFIVESNLQGLEPSDILLSNSLANKLFGSTDCVDRQIVIQDSIVANVRAVYHDFPHNSTFKPEALCSYDLNREVFVHCSNGWKNWCYATLTKIPEGADVVKMGQQITSLLQDKYEMNEVFSLYPLVDYHLSPIGEESMVNHLVMIFFSGLLVLVVSGINFINLQMAINYKRSRQNGIKKMLGVSLRQLLVEIVLESAFYVFAALLVSLIVSYVLMPYISDYIGFSVLVVLSGVQWIGIHLLAAVVVFVIVAAYLGVVVLRNAGRQSSLVAISKEKMLHGASKAFVIAQFTLAIFIGISAFVMQKQLTFAIESDKGYDASNLMYVDNWDYPFEKNRAAICEYLDNMAGIEAYSVCDRAFNSIGARTSSFENPHWSDDENDFYKVFYRSDEKLFNTTRIRIIEGREFAPDTYNETNNIIINETFARMLGGNQVAVGKVLKSRGLDQTIIGVCNNFRFESYYKQVEPMVLKYHNDRCCNLLIKTSPENFGLVKKGLNEYMASLADAPFVISSMESLLADLYAEEEIQLTLLMLFCVLTIVVSCLGLFSLTAFVIENRTKEIGVRKVNGATMVGILVMLNGAYTRYVLSAFLIATPIAWLAMDKWLSNFAYKTTLNWWIFALAGTLVLTTALLSVSWQSWRAASQNPVNSLRYE